MNLQKLRAMREGQRRIVSRQLEKFNEELTELDKSELLDVIASKADIIKGLNENIINNAEIEDIETELVESEEYSIDLGLKLRRLRESIRNSNIQTTNQLQREYNHQQRGSCSENGDSTIQPTENTNINNQNVSNNLRSFPAQTHKLPKLRLPEFDGDITMWQTFWDSYDSAVHSNPSLSDVQKFNYLRSLVHGTAAAAISGFPLTHVNYGNAVELLKERFGKPDLIRSTLMQSLLDLPKPNDNAQSLRSFHDKMETLVRGLESLGQSQASYGDLLIPIILKKLPEQMKQNMAREQRSVHWEFQDLRSAISREITILEAGTFNVSSREADVHIPTASFFTGTKPKVNEQKNERTRNYNQRNDFKKVCPFCNGEHFPNECKNVTSYESRMSIVKRDKLCFNCLKKHQVSSCRSTNRCHHCKRKHHTSICEKYTKQQVPSTLNPEAASFIIPATPNEPCPYPDKSETAALHSTSQPTHDVLLKTSVADVCSDIATVETNILFDEGAQRSFITEELAEKLQLEMDGKENICLASFGGSSGQKRYLSKATIHLRTNNGEKIAINVLVVPTIAVPIITHREDIKNLKYLQGLKLAHPVGLEEKFEVSLLIGADHYWKVVQDKIIRGNGPTAVKSKIGYLLSGPLQSSQHTMTSNHVLKVITCPPDNCDLEKFWTLESMGISADDNDKPEIAVIDSYKRDNITYQNGRYVAKLPWKEDHPPLPSNYSITKKRTENTVRRLSREPKLLTKYAEIIDDQLNRGFIEKVDSTQKVDHTVHYIPHHYVKKDSSTTPIRIVFDCSCSQSKDDPSLNECLLSTPPELNDLTGILLRFRMEKYGVSTDIEKAFLQVGLDERDRDVTRFLWLSDPSDPNSPLTTYRFKAVLFGATFSPFILSATILKHLETNKENCVSERLRKDLYVDNVISSFSRENDLLEYYQQSRSLMLDAGFNLRSWSSNNLELNKRADIDHVLDKDACTKVLGMRCDSSEDRLKFAEKTIPICESATKREILQQTSRLYDPLSLLSPVSLRAKLLIQELWKGKFEWDQVLPAEIHKKWLNLLNDINTVTATTFQRHYFPVNGSDMTGERCIHIFCDSSITSYGAVAYICQDNQSTLMMAKTRVAPIKTITLPRLELMAAVIGARLCKHLQDNTDVSQIYLWSDSQIVLTWLRTQKPLPRFVRNRVSEIKTLTDDRNWRYCPTGDNPADLLTRGISAAQYKTCDLWFHGPTWINKQEDWPVWTEIGKTVTMTTSIGTNEDDDDDDDDVSVRKTCGNLKFIDFTKYSRLGKLHRIVAYICRFIYNCRVGRALARLEPLNVKEIHRAEKACIRTCQTDAFSDVKTDIISQRKRHSIIKQLQLFVDSEDLIRCEGRIHNSSLHEDTKHPYLLPAKHHYTKLVIQDAHERLLHSGVGSTITFIRQKYWIPSIRQCVKSVVQKCNTCIKVTGKPYPTPDPPPLPKSRVTDVTPFTYTGVDFTGALNVRDANGKDAKAYICLFTCATTRAVHLEIVPDLSTGSFIEAFRRFCSRKSTPSEMVSDNGTTFTAAARQLQQLAASSDVRDELNNRGINWKFIPKRSPWFGGFWERLIGLTKSTLKKVLGHSYVTFMTLQTIVTEVEAILNDRPLTYVISETNHEPDILTPAHLLYGRRITTLPHPTERRDIHELHIDRSYINEKATRQKTLINNFRDRWRHEYLTALRERHHTHGRNKQTISVGDVVQITMTVQGRYGNWPWLRNCTEETMELFAQQNSEPKMDLLIALSQNCFL